jgi:hypothetical protein
MQRVTVNVKMSKKAGLMACARSFEAANCKMEYDRVGNVMVISARALDASGFCRATVNDFSIVLANLRLDSVNVEEATLAKI